MLVLVTAAHVAVHRLVQSIGRDFQQVIAALLVCERPLVNAVGQAPHMDASRREAWFRSALLIGLVYGLIGRLFALPANEVHAWRLAAWIVSGAVYAAHIGYEHFRLRNSPRSTALHVAVAVAIGTIALIGAGMLHDLSTASTIRAAWVLALVVLPVGTAVPAFLGALVAGAILRHLSAARSGAK